MARSDGSLGCGGVRQRTFAIGVCAILPAIVAASCGIDMAPDPATILDADAAVDPVTPPPPRGCADAGRPTPSGDPVARAVTTHHNDVARTGVYAAERTLTPAAVRDRGMQLAYARSLGAAVDVQPLYVPDVPFADGAAGALFVATMQNGVGAYALDDGTPRWSVKLADADPGKRSLPRGITSTPVIDLATRTIYVLFSTKNQVLDYATSPEDEASLAASLDVAYWLVALDLRTGNELRRVQVSASAKRSDGSEVAFVAKNQVSRPALLLDHGAVTVAFGMRYREEIVDYHGWAIRYDAASFAPMGAFCTSVEAEVPKAPYTFHMAEGAGIWQGGAGLAADPEGAVYVATGNALADPAHGWFGDSAVRLSTDGGALSPSASYQPDDAVDMEEDDLDLGAGGMLVVPGTPWATVAGKTGVVYLFDRGSMKLVQRFQAFTNTYHPEWTHGCPDPNPPGCASWESGPHAHGSPTYWRGPEPGFGWFFHWAEKDYVKRYRLDLANGRFEEAPLVGPVRATEDLMPGGMLSLSSAGNERGSAVVWAALPTHDAEDHVYAFDAETLESLWDARFPAAVPRMGKWMPPTIADGRVVLAATDGATGGGFAVYELAQCPAGTIARTSPRAAYQPAADLGRPPLAERFDSEESVGALSVVRREQLAPPGRPRPKLAARTRGCAAPATAEALDEIGASAPLGRRVGDVFHADDGSSVTVRRTRAVSSPDGAGPPWELYRVVAHGGEGRLSDVTWIQRTVAPLRCETHYVFFAPR